MTRVDQASSQAGAARSKRSALLLALTLLVVEVALTQGSDASHSVAPDDDRRWIAQAGNGAGESTPVIPGFTVQTVLFDPDRFPRATSQGQFVQREGFTKYLAFGTIPALLPDGSPNPLLARIALSKSDDGLRWSEPEPATLRDPEGRETEFLINDTDGYFDVVFDRNAIPILLFGGVGSGSTDQFIIYYRILNGNPGQVASIHRAVSGDGTTWTADTPVGTIGNPLVTGNPATFNAGSRGPTDVILNARGQIDPATCAQVDPDGDGPKQPSPFNCLWTMLYDAVDGSGRAAVAIAVSGNGRAWNAATAPLVPPGGAGVWDDGAATQASLRLRHADDPSVPTLYDLYYAGARLGDTACDGAPCMSLGTATSNDGQTFAKTSANAVAPASLFETVLNPDSLVSLRGSIQYPIVVPDAGQNGDTHARIYVTRVTNTAPDVAGGDVFLAYTEPAPTQAPRIRISSPQGAFRSATNTPITFYVTDTLGSAPDRTGVDVTTLQVTLDGVPVDAGRRIVSPHLVGALTHPSLRVDLEPDTILDEGLHVIAITIRDLDGNEGVASTDFVVDVRPPVTKLTRVPEGDRIPKCLSAPTRIGCQLGSFGRFEGETIESSTLDQAAIARMEIFVTNPIGQRTFFLLDDDLITSEDSKVWTWSWVVPNLHPHFFLPGNYTFSFLASDRGQAREEPSAENTVNILVL